MQYGYVGFVEQVFDIYCLDVYCYVYFGEVYVQYVEG